MNFENVEVLPPLRVLFVNPLTPAARCSIAKILSGVVFGLNQIVELILVVYSNEIKQASALVYAMEKCAFPCYKSIKVSTAMPTVEDADVFVFDTTFANPNIFDFKHEHSNDNFNSLYLLLKVANNLVMPKHDNQEDVVSKAVNSEQRKPIFVCDGLVAMDILHTFSTNVPSNCFFCPTIVPGMAKSLLGDHLQFKFESDVKPKNLQVLHNGTIEVVIGHVIEFLPVNNISTHYVVSSANRTINPADIKYGRSLINARNSVLPKWVLSCIGASQGEKNKEIPDNEN